MRAKWLVAAVAVVIALAGFAFTAGAAVGAKWGIYRGFEIVKVRIDGADLQSDVPAIYVDGKTLAPLRAVAEALGATVEWDAAAETAVITTGDGDGTTSPATGQTLPLTIGAKGFTALATDSRVNVVPVAWGAEISNPNATQAALDVVVVITFRSTIGTVLATEEARISYIAPGQTALVSRRAGLTACPAPPTSMEVAAVAGSWDRRGAAVPAFTFTNLNVTRGAYWGMVAGSITNPYDSELIDVPVSLVFYNSRGAIIGGEYLQVARIPAGGTVAFCEPTTADLTVAAVRGYATVPAAVDPHK